MMNKIRVGVLFGGRSGEHDVSLTSAASVVNALDSRSYDVVPIGITREGRWVVGAGAECLLSGDRESLPNLLVKGTPVTASVDPTGPRFVRLTADGPNKAPLNNNGFSGETLAVRSHPTPAPAVPEVDVVFPVLHGTFGEDGTVQGLLELAGIPYVGAGVLGSAVGMDKDVMKRLFRDAGLPVVNWMLVLRSDWEADQAAVKRRIAKEIGFPLFVKPANLGSSVGISKVQNARGLSPALDVAARYDRRLVVEQGVNAREIECSVLGNERPEASLPGEIVPVNEFYDYEAKYIKEGSNLIIPAKLSRTETRRVQKLAVSAFQTIDCAGMARVDFLLDRESRELYVNEINTIPGFTPISMYPKLWEASGLSYPELVHRLISLALERHRDKSRTQFAFDKSEKTGS
jgi:D-alanine-D-alanine ligase